MAMLIIIEVVLTRDPPTALELFSYWLSGRSAAAEGLHVLPLHCKIKMAASLCRCYGVRQIHSFIYIS